MTIKEFIEKAIEGGYNKSWFFSKDYIHMVKNITHNKGSEFFTINFYKGSGIYDNHIALEIARFVLIPEVWQAVGKVDGWEDICDSCGRARNDHDVRHIFDEPIQLTYQKYMHRMVDALCDGRSIEEFLKTL